MSQVISAESVKQFFTGLRRLREANGEEYKKTKKELKELLSTYPGLFDCKCPSYDAATDDEEDEDWLDEGEGLTALEFMCTQYNLETPKGFEMLGELVFDWGAIPTDKCYKLIRHGEEDGMRVGNMEILLLSGYMPIKLSEELENYDGDYYLDVLAGDFEDEEEDQFPRILKMFHPKQVKVGDYLHYGNIEAHMIPKLKNLPKLKSGVTHKKDGPFDEILIQWRKDNNVEEEEEEEEQDKENGKEEQAKTDEGAPKKKKQRC